MLLLARLSLKRDAGETAREQGRTNFQDMVPMPRKFYRAFS